MNVVSFIADNILGQVPILIGLITMIGLVLQRKQVSDVIAGTMRAAIGIAVLLIGVDIFSAGLSGFQKVLASAMGTQPPSSDHTLDGFLVDRGGTIALVLTFAFLVHLVMVRLFPSARYVYLTGHLMFWVSTVVVASFVVAFPGVSDTTVMVAGTILVACYFTVQPLLMMPVMRRLGFAEKFGLAHTSSSSALVTAAISKSLARKQYKDAEKVNLPKQLGVFKDVNVSTAVVIAVIMLIATAFADKTLVSGLAGELKAGLNPWVWCLLVALNFAAGIAIMLYGVRMFLSEIVPAFKGISDRLIPGTKPALDAPTIFPASPTAVMLGFVTGTVTFLLFLVVFTATGWFTLAPPMIMLFFVCGTAAVCGNAYAGWVGAVIGGVLSGAVLAVGQAVTWSLFAPAAPELATLADPDWYLLAWSIKGLSLIGGFIWLIPALAAVATVAFLVVLGRHERQTQTTEPVIETN